MSRGDKIKFKTWLENTESKTMNANIPLPRSIFLLRNIMKKYNYKLYVVGGAVRDFLRSPDEKPKDVDVCTDALPQKVGEILTKEGISNFPKGEAFGVWVAHIDKEDIEIATFRDDGKYTDGRRPDKVTFSSIESDYKRRDLTMNALYYEIPEREGLPGKIIDFGDGINHAKNGIVQSVGKAHDRFEEDKLRIPRLIRFFSRFNPGEILEKLDKDTVEAIRKFKDLQGVSPERIVNEFIAGLYKSSNSSNYIKNYNVVGLLPAVFPKMNVNLNQIERIGNEKNINAVLAWIFRNENPSSVRTQLNKIKYPNTVADSVAFLIKMYNFRPQQIPEMLKQRDLWKQIKDPILQEKSRNEIMKDIQDFARISGKSTDFNHFVNYNSPVKTQEFLHLTGKEIGDAKNAAEINSYSSYLRKKKDEPLA